VAQRAWTTACLACAVACGGSPRVANPIPDVPLSQQRAVSRNDFSWQWPFIVGVGTLGCKSGAVIFRSDSTNYAVNDAAAAQGFASARPLQLTVDAGPRNPLARIKQETRMQIFARSAACGAPAGQASASAGPCRQRLRETHGLSEDELKQIDAEGNERRWRPLAAEYTNLAPLVEAGLALCPK
jgi:hypothetical protein